jgi:exosortase sorting signal-containing protein
VAELQVQINVPVPTLSPWMLALLTLALASIAVLFIRRNT